MSKDKFYSHRKWRDLRARVLKERGKVCVSCGATVKLQVDHILPRSKYPDLEYEFSNLQVLCAVCNNNKRAKTNQIIRVPYEDSRWFQHL